MRSATELLAVSIRMGNLHAAFTKSPAESNAVHARHRHIKRYQTEGFFTEEVFSVMSAAGGLRGPAKVFAEI